VSPPLQATWEDNYQVHSVALYIGSSSFLGLDPKKDFQRFDNGTWPLDGAMVAALREALAEHPTGYASHSLACVLVRTGAEDREVMEHLHPWDRLMFRWREAGLNAAEIVATLRAADCCDELDPTQLAMIDGWIAQPISEALFGLKRRLVLATVKDPDVAQHDKLLRELLAKAVPPRRSTKSHRVRRRRMSIGSTRSVASDARMFLSGNGSP
jgi:hypothetical protein